MRKRRSKKGLFRISTGNSSSSSLDGDLAYGTGFIKQSKHRIRSRKGKEIDRERYSEREKDRYRERDRFSDRGEKDRYSDRERPGSGIGRRSGSKLERLATDAEILAVGAGLAKIARDQNKADLRSRGASKQSESFSTSRGLQQSKLDGQDNDDDGWESASDDESDYSVTSALAFDNDNNPSKWKNFFSRRKYKPKSRKSSIVDPRLFGRQNSLHGHVDEPVGFGDVAWNSSTDFGQGPALFAEPESASASQQSLIRVEPIPTDDRTRYDDGRGSRQYNSQPGSSSRVETRHEYRRGEDVIVVQHEPQPAPVDSRYDTGRARDLTMPGQFVAEPEPIIEDPRYTTDRKSINNVDQYSSPQSRPAPYDRYQESSRYQESPRRQENDRYADYGRDEESKRYQEQHRSEYASGPADREDGLYRRPEPIPLQQPQPITPVSQKVFEPTYPVRSESGGILKRTPSSNEKSSSLAKAALAGVAGIAAGTAIASAREDRKERKREEEEESERIRLKRRDSDKKESKDDRPRSKRSTSERSDRDDKKDKSRDKDKKKGDSDEKKRDKKESKREETRDEKEERREKRREERRSERSDFDPRSSTRSDVSTVIAPVDPFAFQVRDDAFPTPTTESVDGHRRIEAPPSVVTVAREPSFAANRGYSANDSYADYGSQPSREYFPPPKETEREVRDREERDRPLHQAEQILEETKHATAPYDSVIMSTVIAAENDRQTRSERRRAERKSDYDYDDYSNISRSQEPETRRDPIQEEADKAYREIVMARKIASEVIRQRTPSPNRSVVHKYEHKDEDDEPEVYKIVTPPEMVDQKREQKGLYGAPDADFVHDYEFRSPKELKKFVIPEIDMIRSLPPGTLPKRDPDTIQPRPILNIVRPTPTPSPMPEKQANRSRSNSESRRSKSAERPQNKRSSASENNTRTERVSPPRYAASEVIIGPRGNVIVSPTAPGISRSTLR